MRPLFLPGAVAVFAVISPVWAQVPYSAAPAYPGPSAWRAAAPTPDDAYRQGLLNRWQLEQIEGPLPQALQGPSPNGTKGMQTGGE